MDTTPELLADFKSTDIQAAMDRICMLTNYYSVLVFTMKP